jgi:hypothetical protein
MKTFEEIRREIISNISTSEMMVLKESKQSFADIERLSAKEYAKQWVVIAVALAGVDRGVNKNESTINLINNKIDAQ